MHSRLKGPTLSTFVIYTIIGLLLVICLFPFLNIFAISLSSNRAIISNMVSVLPVQFTTVSYQVVFRDNSMMRSLIFTIALTFTYTLLAMTMTIFMAYPMTFKELKGRNIFLVFFLLTMYFSGGMIPDYLLIRDLGLINKVWALILPGLISTYNMIIMRTFFNTIPDSLKESARLDGCSNIRILFSIIIPLSTAAIATLSLFYAVGKWNSFQDALFYISNPNLYPLQLRLYNVVFNNMAIEITTAEGMTDLMNNVNNESLKAACIIFSTVPILVVYPWLQKYFIKGVMIGALKG